MEAECLEAVASGSKSIVTDEVVVKLEDTEVEGTEKKMDVKTDEAEDMDTSLEELLLNEVDIRDEIEAQEFRVDGQPMFDRVFICRVCNVIFNDKENLGEHANVHIGDQKLLSGKLDRSKFFVTESSGSRLMLACRMCEYKCYDMESIELHLKGSCGVGNPKDSRQTGTDKKLFKCTFCYLTYSSKKGLQDHLQTHTDEKLLECSICDHKFDEKSNLKTHLLVHGQEESFDCAMCDLKYVCKADLKKHILTHLKPLTCDICGYKVSGKNFLMAHLQSHMFKCKACDFKCSSRQTLLDHHLQAHIESRGPLEKWLKCQICDFKCLSRHSLRYHLRRHGENPYDCKFCDYKASQNTSLKIHVRTHMGITFDTPHIL